MTTVREVREALRRSYARDALAGAGVDKGEAASPYEIGRQALDGGVGLIDLIAAHREAERQSHSLRDDALLDLVAPFEMAVRGYEETIDRLRRANVDLAMMNRAIAHDLRNPVATISIWTAVAQRRLEVGNREVGDVVDQIARVARYAGDLIGDLNSYAALEAEATTMGDVELDMVVHDVVLSLAAAIDEGAASVSSDPLPTVRGHRTHMAHVFQNLVSNAIKYRGELPPRIHIDATRDGAFWTIRCHDNGTGVPAESREQVFEPFWRGPGAVAQGTGLGLAVCRRIVTQAGGRIWIDDPGEGGTTVALTLRAA
jgi:signal transduction histidine kinase